MEEKTNQFPTEEVTLPSKGLLYSKDSPLSTGVLEMKYMTARFGAFLFLYICISELVLINK